MPKHFCLGRQEGVGFDCKDEEDVEVDIVVAEERGDAEEDIGWEGNCSEKETEERWEDIAEEGEEKESEESWEDIAEEDAEKDVVEEDIAEETEERWEDIAEEDEEKDIVEEDTAEDEETEGNWEDTVVIVGG